MSEEAFNTYYEKIYNDRWEILKQSLLEDVTYEEIKFNNKQPYYINKGSFICANELPIEENDIVLDMCAAPGGKSLILASKLKGTGELQCNELSDNRRYRLKVNIQTVLDDAYQTNIKVTGYDASLLSQYKNCYFDKILCDVPCSSEEHLLKNPKYLKDWSPNRIKSLSYRQFAILASGLDSLKEGGYILYSTCSINKFENDKVIEKLLKKRKGKFEIISPKTTLGENTEYGKIILPDFEKNIGPIFFCLIQKTNV